MPHYLIEFRFHGYANKYLKRQIFEVARRFHVKGVTRKRPVPHISLAGPFETRDIKRVIRDVEIVAKNYKLVNFKLKGFGYFNNPNGKVIYADIEPSKELEELRWELAKRLTKYAELKEWDKNNKFSFHATIAFKDIDRKFSDIWRYLKSKEEPNINQHLLRITIIGGGSKIVSEYDLMLKRILNRRQALSKRIWKKTIFRLKIKLFRRKLLAMIKKIFRWS
ncbi:MAG: 2'-5' RNA ligase family protein [Euryarchaeota archaeon]|nr:2'-5' RNA ligase family protein [Euryarchaeota archaeon]